MSPSSEPTDQTVRTPSGFTLPVRIVPAIKVLIRWNPPVQVNGAWRLSGEAMMVKPEPEVTNERP